MKILKYLFHICVKIIKVSFVFIRKIFIVQCMVMGNIFGNKPIAKNEPAKKGVGREKDK